MKKTFYAILVVCLLLALSACQKSCEHSYTEKITTEASCSQVGTKTFTCSLCGDSYTEEIPMVEHTLGKSSVTKKSTCLEMGELTAQCTVCGATELVRKLDLANHTYSWDLTTSATCQAEGKKTYTCTVCKDSYTERVAKKSHNYTSKVTKKATCSSTGTKTSTCNDCGHSIKETIPKTDHKYNSTVTKSPTYKVSGTKKFTCSVCGDSYTTSIAGLSANSIIEKANKGSAYITTALDYMQSGLENYQKGNHTSGRNNTANMLVNTGFATNCFREAYELCGSHQDMKEVKSLLSKIINRLEYVQKYDSVNAQNYLSIILDIFDAEVYQDATTYESQLLKILERL